MSASVLCLREWYVSLHPLCCAAQTWHVLPRNRSVPQNLHLVEAVKGIAAKKGCTAGQLALAWVHAQGQDVFTIPGTKRIK
jgi:aryl-alcohol dehydrogenase-like predicted oxidoreductase